VKTKNETEDLPESYLTENGTPWMQTKKEPESKSEINIHRTEKVEWLKLTKVCKKQLISNTK